jgi:hypothetical protein
MNIIFGKEAAETIKDKHTLLELDTIIIGDSEPMVVYCVIEHIPLDELPKTNNLAEMHAALIDNYRKRNWEFCEQAIGHLMGSWNKEADTFYEELLKRITQFKENEPDDSWTGIIIKS